jgi:hypothetical protein
MASKGFTAYAQDSLKAQNNGLSLEGQIYPNINTDNYRPQLKIRYNFNEKIAMRCNTSFQRNLINNTILQSSGDGIGYVEKINSFYSFSIGIEGQKKFNKAVVYTGLEGVFGFGSDNEYGSRTDSVSFISNLNYNRMQPVQQIGIRFLTGFDYNINEKIYLGFEMGLILLRTNYKKGSFQQINSTSLTDPNITSAIPDSFSSSLSYNGLGALRIGWRFSKK